MKRGAVSRLLLPLLLLLLLLAQLHQRTHPPLCLGAPTLSEKKDIAKGGCKVRDLPVEPCACIGPLSTWGDANAGTHCWACLIKGNAKATGVEKRKRKGKLDRELNTF